MPSSQAATRELRRRAAVKELTARPPGDHFSAVMIIYLLLRESFHSLLTSDCSNRTSPKVISHSSKIEGRCCHFDCIHTEPTSPSLPFGFTIITFGATVGMVSDSLRLLPRLLLESCAGAQRIRDQLHSRLAVSSSAVMIIYSLLHESVHFQLMNDCSNLTSPLVISRSPKIALALLFGQCPLRVPLPLLGFVSVDALVEYKKMINALPTPWR